MGHIGNKFHDHMTFNYYLRIDPAQYMRNDYNNPAL